MKLQLSISLLVSDRLHTLRRCLDSIVPLLGQIPSELIIVYTGNNPESLMIAKEYTEQVIPFTWCDDFSKARNVGLRAAAGEWFLYLDDDEWFEDVTEILQFFLSGDYKNYETGYYVQRNYRDLTGDSFWDYDVARMVRLTSGREFKGAIHETIQPIHSPVKYFKSFVHHYGYASAREEEKKTDRNIPMLLTQIRNPGCIIHPYAQLANEYSDIGDYEKAEEFSRKGLALSESAKQYRDTYFVMGFLPFFIARQGEHKRAIEVGKEILTDKSCVELSKAQIYIQLTASCNALKRNEEGIEYAEKYHDMVSHLEKYPDIWREQEIGLLNREMILNQECNVYLDGLNCCVDMGNEMYLDYFLSWLPWGEQRMGEEEYKRLEEWKQRYRAQEDMILKSFAKLSWSEDYILFQKALCAKKLGNIDSSKAFFEACCRTKSAVLKPKVVALGLENHWGLHVIMDGMEQNTWEECLKTLLDKVDWEAWEIYLQNQNLYQDSEYTIYWNALEQKLRKNRILHGILHLDDMQFQEEIKAYCRITGRYYNSLYRDEVLENAFSYLPAEYQASELLGEILSAINNADTTRAVALIKQSLNLCQELTPVFRRVLSVISKGVQGEVNPNSEFAILGGQVKESVKAMIDQGSFSQALPVVEQLIKLLPNDLEVLRMRQRILKGIQ